MIRTAPECGCETEGKIVRGMCATHYDRWVHKTPKAERGVAPRFDRQFDSFVDSSAGPDGCWVWTGPTTNGGYGYWSGLASDGQRGLAHRLSLTDAIGEPDPSDLFACHHCDNPPCVNPAHLYWGTAKENSRDVVERGGVHNAGHRSQVCPNGHAIEGENLRVVGKRRHHICRECDNKKSREFQRLLRESKNGRAPVSDGPAG